MEGMDADEPPERERGELEEVAGRREVEGANGESGWPL